MNTFELLGVKAQQNHGLTLQPWQVRQVVGTLMNIDTALNQTSEIIKEYIYQHGTEVLDALVASAVVTQELYDNIMKAAGIIEGEVVADETEGQEDEGPGLLPSGETEGDVDVSETINAGGGEGDTVGVS